MIIYIIESCYLLYYLLLFSFVLFCFFGEGVFFAVLFCFFFLESKS